MPQTPTDPTKAQAWVTKTGDNLDFEFYFPQGPKGDPGGFTLGTLLGTANLDEIKTSGLYRQTSSANATALNNYPRTGNGGILQVQEMSTDYLIQQYRPMTGLATGPAVIHERALNGTVWTPWRTYNTTRVDQTAGRALYGWDELNYREQLVWGDTGWRDVSASIASPDLTGTIFIRRVGSTVELKADLVSAITNANRQVIALPTGFRVGPALSLPYGNFPLTNSSGTLAGKFEIYATGSVWITPTISGSSLKLDASVLVTDPWPTTLPGTAVGTIPNT